MPSPDGAMRRSGPATSLSRAKSQGGLTGLSLLLRLSLLAFGLGRLLALLLARLGRRGDDLEGRRIVLDRDLDLAAMDQFAEQQFLGERLLDLLLDEPAHRTRAVELVVAAAGQPGLALVVEDDVDVAEIGR